MAERAALPVDLPAGVSDGMELRIGGAGHAGRAGGPPGDLYLSVHVHDDPVFERHGPDVFATLEVPMVQAALGAEVEVETLDGLERVDLEPGVAPGATIRLRGKGIPNLGRRGRGDLFLTISVQTPRDLTKEQRRLLEELARARGEPAGRKASTKATLRRPGSDTS
jgi:molecular chaperone DnaJ